MFKKKCDECPLAPKLDLLAKRHGPMERSLREAEGKIAEIESSVNTLASLDAHNFAIIQKIIIQQAEVNEYLISCLQKVVK